MWVLDKDTGWHRALVTTGLLFSDATAARPSGSVQRMEMYELTHEMWSGLVGENSTLRLDDGSTLDLVMTGG